jgi:hypothetical protein
MVPRGYHPLAAIAGYDSYYLNVMAGPSASGCLPGKTTTRGSTVLIILVTTDA